MKKIIMYLMEQKLVINLLVVLILVSGLMAIGRINREAFPEVNFDMVSIKTIYPGGSPDELEKLITIPLEKRLKEVDGIDKVRSYNIENVSVIVVYIEDDVSDKKQVVEDIKDAIALETDLPAKAEKPIVEELKTDKIRVINVAITGKSRKTTYKNLRKAADDLEDFLYAIPGVAEVEDIGYFDREYLVEVNPKALQNYRIGLDKVINTLSKRNVDLPGGALRIGDMEYILRTKGQYQNVNEVLNTVLMVNDLGFVTRISDIGTVKDTFEEADVLERFNGKQAILFQVWKKQSADEIRLIDTIRDSLKTYKPKGLEDKVHIELFYDQSRMTRDRISSVLVNAATGFLLLLLILTVLLGRRMSFIVALGIPIVFMIAFMGMKMGGLTINVITLFGMIMVLGMIVDFGIVVSENSFRYMEHGLDKKAAIGKGVSEVFWPVTVTFICICAAFAPLLFLTGIIGKFIIGIPVVLMICLGASWFVAMYITPAYLNTFAKIDTSKKMLDDKDDNIESGAFGKVQWFYKRVLNLGLKHRYLTLGILLVLLFGSLALVGSGIIGFKFMPSGGEERISLYTTMPQGTNLKANTREILKIEKILATLSQNEIDGIRIIPTKEKQKKKVVKKTTVKKRRREIDGIRSTIGEETAGPLDPKPGYGTHKATIEIFLTEEKKRDRTAYQINEEIRQKVLAAQKKGIVSKKMKIRFYVNPYGPPVGKPINVEIRGKDFDILKKIAKEYKTYLETIDGVYNQTIDLEEGKQEFRYKINDVMAARTDISTYDAAVALNAAFDGAVATSVRKGKDDIKVRVRFPEWARKNRNSINDVMIGTRQGGLIPLSLVANYNKQKGYSQINRLNYMRIVQVQADVDMKKISSVKVNQMLLSKFKDIEKKYPGYKIAYGGEKEDTDKSMGELGVLFLMALLIIYVVLAIFFRSLVIPVVVMSAIPFALVGVIFALLVHGEPMSFMATLGVFSLAGVIVSNTLVLVQFINNLRDQGLSLREALIEGGVIRLRPVLLTSGTTVLALFPTIYGMGGKDYFVAPLALAFGYGLIFATFITLVLIPCFYHIAEDLQGLASRLFAKIGLNMNETVYVANQGSAAVVEKEAAEIKKTPAAKKKKSSGKKPVKKTKKSD